jgi:hypothetical protein
LGKKFTNASEQIRKLQRQIVLSIAVIALLLFLFIPLGSLNPDGLDRVAEDLGATEAPLWEGLFPGYSVALIENPWISTFLAGVVGILLVFAVMLLVTKIFSLQGLRASNRSQQK